MCIPLCRGTFARISVRVAKVWRGDRHVILLVLWTPRRAVVPSRAKGKLCPPFCEAADEARKRSSLWSDPSTHCIGEWTILPGADITSSIVLLIYATFVKQSRRKTCLALGQKYRELHFTTWQPLSYVWSSLLPGRVVKWHRFETFVQTILYCLAERTVVSTQPCKCCGELLVRVRTPYIARELWDMDCVLRVSTCLCYIQGKWRNIVSECCVRGKLFHPHSKWTVLATCVRDGPQLIYLLMQRTRKSKRLCSSFCCRGKAVNDKDASTLVTCFYLLGVSSLRTSHSGPVFAHGATGAKRTVGAPPFQT
jgi:hypothetical protein